MAFRISEHDYFVRDRINIKSEVNVNLSQASLGSEIIVSTIEGDRELDIPSGTQSGQVFKLRGLGVAQLRGTRIGDNFVTVNVTIPSKLTSEQRELLEKLSETFTEENLSNEEGLFDKFKKPFS